MNTAPGEHLQILNEAGDIIMYEHSSLFDPLVKEAMLSLMLVGKISCLWYETLQIRNVWIQLLSYCVYQSP